MKSYGANKTLDIPRKADLTNVFIILDIKDKRLRHIVKKLMTTQQRWIDNEGLQGIQRSKALHALWVQWVGSGYKPEDIPPLRYRHSLLSKLQYAMRFAAKDRRVEVINMISTALRFHQCYGLSDRQLEQERLNSYKTITDPFNTRPLIFGLFDGRRNLYQHGMGPKESNSYFWARQLAEFCSAVESQYDDYHHISFLPSGQCKIDIELERDEHLVKAGPHSWIPRGKTDAVALKSIVSEPLDLIALESNSSAFNRLMTRREDGSITLRPHAPTDRNVKNIIDDINNLILSAPHGGPQVSVVYASRELGAPPPDNFIINTGRIVSIKDKAGKLRNIAMTCYTVNKTLGPIHRWMINLLSLFPCDSTNQQKGINMMLSKTASHEPCESKDLSSATDRLPLIVQRRILCTLLHVYAGYTVTDAEKLASLWNELLSSLNFATPDGNIIRYAVGQPMGVYTSWPMLALSNNIICIAAKYSVLMRRYGTVTRNQHSGLELKKFLESGYHVCGDDIVIYDYEAAEEYHNMMEAFGVEINRGKSFSTKKGSSVSTAEFCKKLVVNGDIMSGQSLKVVLRCLGIDDSYKRAPLLYPQALSTIACIKPGKTLSKNVLTLIGNTYPRELLHIPREYGGLGFPQQGVSYCDSLIKDGFILYYYYNRIRTMLSVFKENELYHPGDKLPDSTLAGQLKLIPIISKCSFYPSNPNRRFELDVSQLSKREWYSEWRINKNLVDCVLEAQSFLSSLIDSDRPPETFYDGDILDIVDNMSAAMDNKTGLIVTRYTASRPKDDDEIDNRDCLAARAALKSVRQIRRKKAKGLSVCAGEDWRSFLVDFAEYLNPLLSKEG